MTPHVKKLIAIACVSLACAASSARIARVGAVGGGTASSAPSLQTPSAPGALAFASERYGVTEGAGSAKIRVRRVGGTGGEVVGKVTLTDVTTSPADYRFSPGARDPAFNSGGSGANGFVSVVAVQPDGKIIFSGDSNFTAYNGDFSAPRNVMRLNADGTRDTAFNPGGTGANEPLRALAVQPDGKIIIGGFFTAYNGDSSAPDGVMRLNADGTRDASFNPGGSGVGVVTALAVQPDGKIIIAGGFFFTAYNGDSSAPLGVMRLNADGTRDASFNPGGSGAGGLVTALAMQPDGKIIFSGDSSAYNGDGSAPRNVIRLNADGTRDTAFNPGGTGAIGPVHALAVQPDGKIIIGGFLTAYNGDSSAPDGVMRLNADGTRDASFNPRGAGTCCAGAGGTDAYVSEVAVQPDGKVVIGGFFTAYNGDFSAPRNVIRLNADGTRDTAFNPGGTGPNGSARAALQPDGKVIIYGSFTAYNGDFSAPDNVMRLDGDLFVTWRAGDAAEKVVHLPIVDDGFAEPDETLSLSLSVVSGGAALGSPHSATLTIGRAANPIDAAPNFVRQHYYDFLSREPDAPGLAFWTDQVTNCGSPNPEVCRINVSAAFFLSIEFGQTACLVERMYKVAYGDAIGVSTLGGPHQVSVPVVRFSEFMADTPLIGDGVIVGQGDWEAQLKANKVAYAQAFVRRQRFRDVYDAFAASPAQYVDRLNENAGGVVTDSGERIGLINEAAAGTDEARASVLRKIAEHPELNRREFSRAFVLMQYFGYLRRDPAAAPDADHTGYEFWLRKLEGFGGDYIRAEMVKAFISSDEYRKRFAQ
ncbi:MAG: fibronectin-binding autotransporter adhesin [Acidobacteriota bacterium]|jgi:uncharacterized delta-60 repeat protein|nr:fibronectin-binding autotransporter adhesin [Acidobacteriota bacterium]